MLCPLMLGAGRGAKTSEAGKGGSRSFPTVSRSNSILPRAEFTARLLSARAER